MSFQAVESGRCSAAGWFLAHGNPRRETHTLSQDLAQRDENGALTVPMGTIYPSNDANAIGFVYEDVVVTSGDMPGSIVTNGAVYIDRLPVAPSEDETEDETTIPGAKSALEALGFVFLTSPEIDRP